MSTPLHVAYSELYQDWQLGAGHPTNPVRAKLAVELLQELLGERVTMHDAMHYSMHTLEPALCTVHDPNYVDRVLTDGDLGDEAAVADPKLGGAALAMFGGTYTLVRRLLADTRPAVYFNPQGAKHHAAWDKASGFCAFNDMAWAAMHLQAEGMRVGYLDWDAHAGDGVQLGVKDLDAVTYFSIHQGGIFPGQAFTMRDYPAWGAGAYNRVLTAGQGDDVLLRCVREARGVFRDKGVDVVLLAAGADGLAEDPLTGLTYTIPGIYRAAKEIGRSCALRGVPIVVGGAGGYTPYKETPITWAGVVMTLLQQFDEVDEAIGARPTRPRLTGGA